MADENLVDMRRKKDSAKEKNLKASNAVQPADSQPEVPYGMHVTLHHEELKKLGMKHLPKAGDKLHMRAHVHVARVSESHESGGEKNRTVEMHIHKMALEQPKKSESEVAKGAKEEMDKVLKAPDYDENHEGDPDPGTDEDQH